LGINASPRYRLTPPVWSVPKFYNSANPRSIWQWIGEQMTERGIAADPEDPGYDYESYLTPDEVITTRVDVTPYVARKRAALMEHETQVSTDDWLNSMPEDLMEGLLRTGCSSASGRPCLSPIPKAIFSPAYVPVERTPDYSHSQDGSRGARFFLPHQVWFGPPAVGLGAHDAAVRSLSRTFAASILTGMTGSDSFCSPLQRKQTAEQP
jgi:hypothetical protein